jgi:signal transduction histidine kinase
MREGETSLVFAWEAEKLEAAKSAATRPLLMLASGSFLCVLALGVLIGRAMLRPVRALLAGAERVAVGDETRDVLVTSGDELQRLAEAFNRMQAAIRRHREDERWAAAGRVAAGVAHDLRNPLTGVLMMAQMLEREEPDVRKRETLGRIVAEVKRLEKSVADLLAMVAPPSPPRREPVDLAAIARESVEHFRAQAGHRGVALEPRDEAAPGFSGDPSHVRRILDNLLENALDATPAKGRVAVVTAVRGGRAELRVEDTGGGIPEAVRARLFEAFSSDKPGGTGLGLATVKRLVDEMKGEIAVESGQAGTAVKVLFPA